MVPCSKLGCVTRHNEGLLVSKTADADGPVDTAYDEDCFLFILQTGY